MAGNKLERPQPTEEQLRAAGINTRPLDKSDREELNRKRAQEQIDREDADLSPLTKELRDAERNRKIKSKANAIFNEF